MRDSAYNSHDLVITRARETREISVTSFAACNNKADILYVIRGGKYVTPCGGYARLQEGSVRIPKMSEYITRGRSPKYLPVRGRIPHRYHMMPRARF